MNNPAREKSGNGHAFDVSGGLETSKIDVKYICTGFISIKPGKIFNNMTAGRTGGQRAVIL
jgi:hypothetical protein